MNTYKYLVMEIISACKETNSRLVAKLGGIRSLEVFPVSLDVVYFL